MAKGYVIYNPLAGNGTAEEDAELLQMVFDENLECYDNDGLQLFSTFLRDGSLIVCPGSPVQIGIQHGSHGRGILFIVELPLILQTVGIHTIIDQIAQDTVTAAAEVCQKIEIISKFLREILPQESFPVLLRHQMPVVFPDGAVQFRYLFLRKRREQSIQNIRIVTWR